MEKVINFRENDYTYHVAEVKKELTKLQSFLHEIQEVVPVTFTSTLFQDAAYGSGSAVEIEIKKVISEQLTKAGIVITSIKTAAINESLEAFYSLKNKQNFNPNFSQYFIIKDGEVCLIDGFEDEAKKQFQHVIRTEKGLELYEKHLKIVEAVNDFQSMLPVQFRGKLLQFINIDFNNQKTDYLPTAFVDYDRLANG